MRLMKNAELDMTLFFRQLADVNVGAEANSEVISDFMKMVGEVSYQDALDESTAADFQDWFRRYCERSKQDPRPADGRRKQMQAVNPLYVLRNYLAQEAIEEAERGDYALLHELQSVLRNPYTWQEGKERFTRKRPDWAKQKAGCSMLSCSS